MMTEHDDDLLPEAALPIPLADPKAPLASSTILWSLAGIGAGLGLLTLPLWLPMPGDVATALYAAGLAQITAGLGAINGRYRAEQPIAPLFGGRG